LRLCESTLNIMFRSLLFTIYLVVFGQLANAQLLTNSGREFWFAFPETYDKANAVYWVNITGNDSTSGTVSIPGQSWTQNFSIKAGEVARVNLPSSMVTMIGSNTNFNKAIKVVANDNVVVFAVTYHAFRHEASLILPNRAAGTRYRAITYSSEIKNGLQESEFCVVAIGDTAVVNITPKANVAGGTGRAANVQYTVTIPPNYVYQAQALGSTDDLTGSLITSKNGKKFAVYSGNVWSTIVCSPNSDPLMEGMFPTNTWGKDYFVIPTPNVNKDYIRIVADRDTTKVYRDGVLRATINAGQYYQETITQIRNFTSDKPTAAAHFLITGQAGCSNYTNTDPSMIMLNATEQMFLDSISFFAVDTSAIDSHFVHVLTRTSDTGFMYLDSVKMTKWRPFTQNSKFSYKTERVKPGSHRLETTGCGFIAYSMGVGRAVSYGYATGASLVDLQNSISYTNFITGSDTICQGDTVHFKSLIRGKPISFKWFFGDGDTSNLQNPIHQYKKTGMYEVKAAVVYTCITDTLIDTLIVPPPPIIDLGPDTILCNRDTLKFKVNTQVFRALWSTGSKDSFLVVNKPGTYWAMVYNYCGVGYDTVKIDSLYPDTVDLGPDTILCMGDTLKWDITGVWGSKYLWWDNSTGPTNFMDTGGIYWAQVDNQCGLMRDSINIFPERTPVLDFGPDTVLCTGQGITLNAYFSRAKYKWHDGKVWPFISTKAPGGLHWVEVENLCGKAMDSIQVDYDYPLSPYLGPDTVVCIRDTVILDPVTNGARVLWQDGSTDTTFGVYKKGKYWVEATNACGIYSDTVNYREEYIPQVKLPNDSTLCNGGSIRLNASFSGSKYKWNTGDTLPVYTVTRKGFYEVEVRNICGVAKDDIFVLYDSPLVVDLGSDTQLCDNSSFQIELNYPNNPSYTWSTGHVGNIIRIQHGGIYTVTVHNRCGSFTGKKRVLTMFTPEPDLGPDMVICHGTSFAFHANIPRDKDYGVGYEWQDGREGEGYGIRKSGTYWVRAFNICGEGSDTAHVQINPIPSLTINDSLLCFGEELIYDYRHLNGYSFLWNDEHNEYEGNYYTIDQPGEYLVEISDSAGCTGYERFKVERCPVPLWAPKAFTPNKDHLNDGFRVYKEGIYYFEIEIYDRWNKLVFESNNIEEAWNGTVNNEVGRDCAVGMYIWKVRYKETENHQPQSVIGEVMLVR